MKPIHALALSFCTVLLLAGAMFTRQTLRLSELQGRGHSEKSVAARPPVALRDAAPAPAKVTPPTAEETGRTFVQSIKDQLAATVSVKHVTALSASEGSLQAWLATSDLAPAERKAIHDGLEKFHTEKAALYLDRSLSIAARAEKVTAVDQRQQEWLAGHLGQERSDAFLDYDEEYRRSYAGERAAAAVFRISAATGITGPQQEELREKLLERSLNPPAGSAKKVVIRSFGNITTNPAAPDISAEAEQILTPDQWTAYQGQMKLQGKKANEDMAMIRTVMESLKPAVMELLESKL